MRCRAIGSRTFTSKRKASPLVAFTNPSNTFIVVVFPAPLGPKNPKTSPARTCRFKFLTATFFPSDAEGALYSTRRFLSSTIACIIELPPHDDKSDAGRDNDDAITSKFFAGCKRHFEKWPIQQFHRDASTPLGSVWKPMPRKHCQKCA